MRLLLFFLIVLSTSWALVIDDELVTRARPRNTLSTSHLPPLAPARFLNTRTDINSNAHLPDFSGDDEDDDADDEALREQDKVWAKKFFTGEHVDPLLDFDASDVIHEYRRNNKFAKKSLLSRTSVISRDEEHEALITELANLRLGLALTYAHCRSRLRRAGKQPTGTPDAEDIAWARAFMLGKDVDDNMIFNSTDLEGPVDDDDDTDYLDVLSHALNSAAVNATSALIKKSCVIQEFSDGQAYDDCSDTGPTATQIMRRSLRSIRRARRRARERKRAARRFREKQREMEKQGLRKWEHHLKYGGGSKHGKHNRPHHTTKPSHPQPTPGWNPDGSLNCEWWWCHENVLNCGESAPNPSWNC